MNAIIRFLLGVFIGMVIVPALAEYIRGIIVRYNAKKLGKILAKLTEIINANQPPANQLHLTTHRLSPPSSIYKES